MPANAQSAAVLTGGQSRRMGFDKAFASVNGRPLLQRTLDVLTPLSDDIFIVGFRPEYRHFDVAICPDSAPGSGPLGGIADALRAAEHDHVLVVACDMPFLNTTLLEAITREVRDYDVLVPIVDGQLQPLHAVYTKRCLPAIEGRLKRGDLKVTGFYRDVRVRGLGTDWLREFDPQLRSFTNMNTVAELESAQRAGESDDSCV